MITTRARSGKGGPGGAGVGPGGPGGGGGGGGGAGGGGGGGGGWAKGGPGGAAEGPGGPARSLIPRSVLQQPGEVVGGESLGRPLEPLHRPGPEIELDRARGVLDR